jgi:hypothetical protein
MAENFEEYSDLADTGFQGGGGEKTAPEDEFFHSVYIAGQSRKNHLGIIEEAGKFQVRGFAYNLDEVHMVIIHTKDILAKIKTVNKQDTIECFSYKDGIPPWHGTSKLGDGSFRPCPMTSAERGANDFCNPCRAQILIAGIYCNKDGSPILTEERKPIFVFIRGKGMRYSNVSEYLNDLFNDETLVPLFQPVTEQSKEFEKRVVNNKRFITRITRDIEQSSFGGSVNVFVLKRAGQLDDGTVMKILKLSKETKVKFNDKFDWSKSKQAAGAASGYSGVVTPPPVKGVLTMEDALKDDETTTVGATEKPKEANQKTFSFDDIEF